MALTQLHKGCRRKLLDKLRRFCKVKKRPSYSGTKKRERRAAVQLMKDGGWAMVGDDSFLLVDEIMVTWLKTEHRATWKELRA